MHQLHEIILASGSPRRRELLTQAGLHFTVMTADVDETPTETEPKDVVEELSRRKAEAVAAIQHTIKEKATIVAADTIVAYRGEILGKPGDEEDAIRMLMKLSGETHQVFTGVTLLLPEGRRITFSNETHVCFYPLTEAEIRDYVATGEPLDKAGAYGIQGRGARLVESIRGDYNNVVGFPLAHFLRIMVEAGELDWDPEARGQD